MNSVVTFFALLSVFVVGTTAQQPVLTRARSCRALFNECELIFNGYSDTIPVWDVTGASDIPFTTRIISRNLSEVIGIVNTNENPSQFVNARSVFNITIGTPPLTPTHFKVFPIAIDAEAGIYGSGVGLQRFTGNQMAVAKNKCVRMYISSYQTLDPDTFYVSGNVNDIPRSAHKCVVFYTAP